MVDSGPYRPINDLNHLQPLHTAGRLLYNAALWQEHHHQDYGCCNMPHSYVVHCCIAAGTSSSSTVSYNAAWRQQQPLITKPTAHIAARHEQHHLLIQ
jgi:hypothetical protein